MNLEAEANWVYFLAHYLVSFAVSAFTAGFFLGFSLPVTSTRMFADFFWNGSERPRAAGLNRFKRVPAVTEIVERINVLPSSPWVLIAFALALSIVLVTGSAARFGTCSRITSASA